MAFFTCMCKTFVTHAHILLFMACFILRIIPLSPLTQECVRIKINSNYSVFLHYSACHATPLPSPPGVWHIYAPLPLLAFFNFLFFYFYIFRILHNFFWFLGISLCGMMDLYHIAIIVEIWGVSERLARYSSAVMYAVSREVGQRFYFSQPLSRLHNCRMGADKG